MKVELISYITLNKLMESLPVTEIAENELLSHLSYTFTLEDLSRACSHQIVRHRTASFSQQSQRYIQVKRLQENVVTPSSISDKAPKAFETFVSKASETYTELVEAGVPKEDARFVLPNATETCLIMTMDGRSLIHFFGLRLCNRAQWEIRTLAEEMLNRVKEVEPELFSNVGPYCVQLGHCPEGRFSCGRIAEMTLRYGLKKGT
jgi:thymidylate synthase (FAD)